MGASAGARTPRVRRAQTALAVGLVLLWLALIFDWNWFKGPLERRISTATGRSFQIGGDFDVDLSLQPKLIADAVVLGNTPGAAEPVMATADRVSVRIDALAWLRGRWHLPEIQLSRPRILLEVDDQGRENWIFHPDAERTPWPQIDRLVVEPGQLRYRNARRDTDIRVDVHSGPAPADGAAAPLLIDGRGRHAGNPFTLAGSLQSPLALEHRETPYHLDLRARSGATSAHATGQLRGALPLGGFDLDFRISGPDLALLYPLIGVTLPPTPPYRLRGQLGKVAHTWSYRRFSGVVGDSDLAGDASVDTGGERPFLHADLVSRRLDFDDLGGFVGAPPQTGGSEAANAAQKQQAAAQRASPRLLPDAPYRLERIRAMDADVRLRAARINSPRLPLEAMDAHLYIDDGVVRLDPLRFAVAGGHIDSRLRLDARGKRIATTARIDVRGLQLPQLFPDAKLAEDSTGRIAGRIDLAGDGNSVADMLASSDGEVGLLMGRGRISNLMLEYAGLDIAESLRFLLGKDRRIPIRCAFADFAVVDGVMTSRRLAFDTTDTVILGEGRIDLGRERLDLRLRPRPKDRSWLSLRSPLRLGGSFKDPSFRPDAKALLLRGGAALALAAIAPPAALLALLETGPGKDVDCGGPDPV